MSNEAPVCQLRKTAHTFGQASFPDPEQELSWPADTIQATAVVGGGCFWCVEAVFECLAGVETVVSGYAGGSAATANYQAVCSGVTDHAEVVQIMYRPDIISYGALLKVFFSVAHNPTQLNHQGNDQGRQYRSAVFYQSDAERQVAHAYIQQLNQAKAFTRPIATSLEPLTTFHQAEDYHQGYARQNPHQPYIAAVAEPKVRKLHQAYAQQLDV